MKSEVNKKQEIISSTIDCGKVLKSVNRGNKQVVIFVVATDPNTAN